MYVLFLYNGLSLGWVPFQHYIEISIISYYNAEYNIEVSVGDKQDKLDRVVSIHKYGDEPSLEDIIKFFETDVLFKLYPRYVPTYDYEIIDYRRY